MKEALLIWTFAVFTALLVTVSTGVAIAPAAATQPVLTGPAPLRSTPGQLQPAVDGQTLQPALTVEEAL